MADNPRIWALAPGLLSHHLGESWDLTPSEVKSYKSSAASARHGADGNHSAYDCALEVKMERTLLIPRRVHSWLSVLPRVARLPIVLVSLLFVTVLQAGAQDKEALIREALSAARPRWPKLPS